MSRPSGEPVNVISLMEDLNEKLKLLNYEQDFLKKRVELRPLTRTFFAISSKPSDQFPYFSHLVSWLLHLLQVDFIEWNEFDDPNTISTAILDELKKLGLNADFPVSKLRHGSGDAVCISLDFLCDKALQALRFRVQPPIHTNSEEMEEAQVDEAAEIGDEVEEAVAEEEEVMPGLSGPGDFASDSLLSDLNKTDPNTNNSDGLGNMNPVDPVAWRLELERVGPLLKVKTGAAGYGGKEWRTHLEASGKHVETMKSDFPSAEALLRKQAELLRKAVERISSKERQINKEYEHLGSEFRGRQKVLDEVQERYNGLSASVAELTAELQRRSAEVEQIKTSMTERNNSMTDTTPLRKISNSLSSLKDEVKAMELRIGVVGQTLLQSKIRHQHLQQQLQHQHLNAPGASLKNNPVNRSGNFGKSGRQNDDDD